MLVDMKLRYERTHLIVADQPDTGCLVIFIICDHDIVRSHLQQIAFGNLYFAANQKINQ